MCQAYSLCCDVPFIYESMRKKVTSDIFIRLKFIFVIWNLHTVYSSNTAIVGVPA